MQVINAINIFGEPITLRYYSQPQPNGYAAPPGTGPSGKTCRTCEHKVKADGGARSYNKCAANHANWTASIKSDIKSGSPACRLYVAEV